MVLIFITITCIILIIRMGSCPPGPKQTLFLLSWDAQQCFFLTLGLKLDRGSIPGTLVRHSDSSWNYPWSEVGSLQGKFEGSQEKLWVYGRGIGWPGWCSTNAHATVGSHFVSLSLIFFICKTWDQEASNFSVKGQIANILGFAEHVDSIALLSFIITMGKQPQIRSVGAPERCCWGLGFMDWGLR